MRYLLLVCLFLFSCATSVERAKIDAKETSYLSKSEAKIRKKKVSNVRYKLKFLLGSSSEKFSGTSTIHFDLSNPSQDLRVDFSKGEVKKVRVNGEKSDTDYNQHYILISGKHLKKGANIVEITFNKEYSRDGSGLYKFKDPEDGRVYLYSDLEPYDANKVFPCFDQPNLKATYEMQVTTPADWFAVSSTSPTKTTADKQAIWSFPTSQKFSTYIWSLHAGPYKVFSDPKAVYPSRLFARRSLAKFVKVNDWFTFTRQSFEFLNEYFGYEYPYLKYDQLIVPDFNAGAMENVAAVTFSERYVSRGEKTQKARRRLANVIFHEMAHMWFGNLVTMDWWNDLWLNESFATYLANLGVSRNTEFKSMAKRDFNNTKNWAYWEDQLPTTHPIVATVPDTNQAFANFDGITYGKGASSLKQIHFHLGDAGFKAGLQYYFKTYATQNTTLPDFMGALEKGSQTKLASWQKKWLQTTGVNTVKSKLVCVDKKIKKLTLLQTSEQAPKVLRPHSLEIALVKNHKVATKIKTTISKASSDVAEAVGLDCPDLVYPNFDDYAYIKTSLSERDLFYLQNNISELQDPFLRQLIWGNLWQMVYYGDYSYKKFSDLVKSSGITDEKDDFILQTLISRVPKMLFYSKYDGKTDELSHKEFAKSFEDIIWKELVRSKAKSERQKILFNGYMKVAMTNTALKNLENLLRGRRRISGLKIDQDKRWSIIVKLNMYNFRSSNYYLTQELKKDKTSIAKKMNLAALASRPDFANKLKWIEEFHKEKSEYSFSELKTILRYLFPREQKDLRERFASKFFGNLDKVISKKEAYVAEKFVSLAPINCDLASPSNISSYLKTRSNLDPSVSKELRITDTENQRCGKTINFK